MKLLSDRIQEFIDWMIDETDFGDWSDKAQDEVHKKLIVFMISDSKETLLANKPAPIADNCTCWIGRGEHGGSDRHLCSIHKEPVAPPAPLAERKPWCQICGVELTSFYCDTCHTALAAPPERVSEVKNESK